MLRPTLVLFAIASGIVSPCVAQRLVVQPSHPDGIYAIDEVVEWEIAYEAGEGQPAAVPSEVRYTLKQGGLTPMSEGVVPLVDGRGTFQASLDRPGALLAEFVVPGDDQSSRLKALGGAIIAPEAIKPSAPRPEDFDAFWEEKIAELKQTPAHPRLEKHEVDKRGVDYWKITMDHFRGSTIRGQLARPEQGEKLPALLIVQWAGVYPLERSWVTERAANGWLVLNILPHDLPIDEPVSFYEEQKKGPLQNYAAMGNDDRETSYFLRMYLSCYRAAEYLATRDDWDGKTLVAMGTSQGGMQTFVTAAIHPRITAALANVPAGCDVLGPDVGRSPGWPRWFYNTGGRDVEKVREVSRYFDVVNFASKITCPMLVGIGHIDQVCPPSGCYAATNQLQGLKEVVPLPLSGHQNSRQSQRPYNDRCWQAWLPALRLGKPVPVDGE